MKPYVSSLKSGGGVFVGSPTVPTTNYTSPANSAVLACMSHAIRVNTDEGNEEVIQIVVGLLETSQLQHVAMLDPRPAKLDDLSAVEDIVRRAYSPYVTRIGRKPGPMLDNYGTMIADGRVYVVEREGVIQGILVLIPDEEAMLLDNVAVAPSAQGTGLGRGMIEYAEKSAREAGYRSIKLYTNEVMTENIAYYGQIGYSETHRAEEKGLKRVYMIKTLA